MMLRTTTLSLAALGLSLSGCITMNDGVDPPMGSGQCDADDARSLIGQQATADNGQRALDLTGARTLRWGPPGAVFTMDYREDRVNVMYDANMTITQITCG